ncbi:MAG: glycosyl hydrolase [Bryobacteraceae bacterium]
MSPRHGLYSENRWDRGRKTRPQDGVRRCHLLTFRGVVLFLLAAATWLPAAPLSEVYAKFRTPPAGYSMLPLMRINDKVDRAEIRWQFEEMKRHGIHGAFLAPEQVGPAYGSKKDAGMPYEYLSDDFFQMMREAAEEAKRIGFDLWVYDELDWPSGNAAGKIGNVPVYRGRSINATLHSYDGPRQVNLELTAGAEIAAITAYRKTGNRVDATSLQNLLPKVSQNRLSWNVPDGHWEIAVYYLELNKGLYYPYDADLMNAEAMKAFIGKTHAQYRSQVEERTGLRYRGTFTDEPHLSPFRNSRQWHCRYLPWTAALPDTFRRLKGYDIRDRLPLLYFDAGPETAKVRADFWQVIAKMFAANYFGQIARFSHSAGWLSTGHLNGEERFWWHLTLDGGDEFANLAEMDYPGVDWIYPFNFDYTNGWGQGWLSAFAGKLVSSVAHVHNKPRALAEILAAAGYGVSLDEIRNMVNWVCVLGMDMVVPITYKYSLRGEGRSTFYSPGISYQQPWTSDSKPMNDYIARLSYLLSQGRFVGQVAVLLPVTEVWANSQDREYLDNLTRKVDWLTEALLREGYSFDFINDDALQGAKVSAGRLVIGAQRYQAVVLPPARIVSSKSLSKVAEFHRAGGAIIAVDRLPSGSIEKGDLDPQVAATLRKIFGLKRGSDARTALAFIDTTGGGVPDALRRFVLPPLTLRGKTSDIYSQHRRIDGCDFFFLVNASAELREFEAIPPASAAVEVWDPEAGTRESLGRAGSAGAVRVVLRPHQAQFLVLNSGLPPTGNKWWWTAPFSSVSLTGDWRFRVEPTMTAPHLAWNFSPVPEGWQLKNVDYSKVQTLRAGDWTGSGLRYYSGKGIYEKTFDSGEVNPNFRYLLDLGGVGVAATVWLNGNLVGTRLWTPYTFEITGALRPGKNELRISVANTLANYYTQFDALRNAPLNAGGSLPWMLPSGILGPVSIRGYAQ